MRISRLSIDGFGIFRDVDVKDLPPGLSLFLGDNEAGKSTTLGFVHTLLFGYPDGRSKEKTYPPLRGGRAGGRIEFETDSDGRLTLERRDGKKGGPVTITFPDGRSDGHPALARLLGGTTRQLYRNIYAFSLSELQDMETLTGKEVKEIIYGASLGASARSLPEARKHLDARLSELFLSGGRNPEINILLKDLEAVRGELRKAGGGIKEYETLTAELARLENQIADLRQQLASGRAAYEQLKARIALWDDWVELQDAERRLGALAEIVESFPEKGITRLDELVRQVEMQRKELRSAEEDLEEKRARLQRLVFDEALLAKEAEIRVLVQGLATFEKAITGIPRAEERFNSTRGQAKQVLVEFGAGWTEERVLALDRSPMILGHIEDHREALEGARRQLEQTKDAETGVRTATTAATKEDEAARKEVEKLQEGRIDVAPEILAALRERREQFYGVVRDIPKVELRHTTATSALQTLLREINPAWTPETLDEFDGSLTARQKVGEIDARLAEASEREREAASALARAEEVLAETGQAVTRKSKEIEASGTGARPIEDLRERKGFIRSLRDAVTRHQSAHTELHAHRQALDALRAMPASGADGALGRRLQKFAVVVAVLALVAGPALWVVVSSTVGGIAGGTLLLAALVLFMLGRPAARVAAAPGGSVASAGDETIRGLRTRLKTLGTEIATLQTKLGVAGEMKAADVDHLEDENTEQIRAAEVLARLQSDLGERAENHERADARKKSDLAHVEESRVQREGTLAAWGSFASILKLPPGTSPRTAGLVFEKAETARSQARQLTDLETRLSDMRSTRGQYLDLMKGVPRLEPVARDGTAEQQLAALAEFLSDMDREELDGRRLVDARLATARAARQLTAARERLDTAAETHRGAVEADRKVRAAWGAWLREHRMDETWSPEISLRLLDRTARLAELAGSRNEAEEEMDRLRRENEAFSEKVAALCRDLGRHEPSADKLSAEIHAMESALNESSTLRTRHEILSADIPGLESQCGHRHERIEELKTAIGALVASGGAGDEEAFRNRGQLYTDHQELLKAIENHSGNVRKLSGQSDLEALRKALAEVTLPALRAALTSAERTVQKTETEFQDRQQERTRTDERRKQLHNEDAIAKLRTDEESLLERFRVAADDWARHAVAQHLLSTAKERFEQAHQPEVIRQASGYFSSMTGGEYTQIFVPHDGDEEIEVIDDSGGRKSVRVLSRGTAEQLYLAIRFGYIASHGGNGESLPILMDDPLVNFDPVRVYQAAEGILEMAQSHQIFFFTCHPEMVKIFRRHRTDVPVYRLVGADIVSPEAPTRGSGTLLPSDAPDSETRSELSA